MITPKIAKFISNKKKFLSLNAQINSTNIGLHNINKYKKIDKKLKRNFISQNAISKITEWSNKINEIIK